VQSSSGQLEIVAFSAGLGLAAELFMILLFGMVFEREKGEKKLAPSPLSSLP
jgi:hypothetical protein